MHKDQISCLDISPDHSKVATADSHASKPTIYIWDSNTNLKCNLFKNVFTSPISALAFSPSGDKLAAISMDNNHEIAIFDVTANSKNGGVLMIKEKLGSHIITSVKWRT